MRSIVSCAVSQNVGNILEASENLGMRGILVIPDQDLSAVEGGRLRVA